MRIASGGITHETNTFATQPTALEDFVRDSGGDPTFPPESVATRFRGTATIHGGYLKAADQLGIDLIPTLQAGATPGGVIQQSAYRKLKSMLLERLKASLPVEGVLLDLHGAMVTEENQDAEGDIITRYSQIWCMSRV